MQKKYSNGALWRCIKAYPDEELFKMFMGQCYIMGFTRARFMEDILKNYFKSFSPSQIEHLLKKYDECFLRDTIDHWHEIRIRLSHQRVEFLYSKIKYKKVMRLNVPFNEADYNWTIIFKAFDFIFEENEAELQLIIADLSAELKNNILAFYTEVNVVRQKSTL